MKMIKKSVMNLSKGLIAAALLAASFAQAEETAPAAEELVVNQASSLDEFWTMLSNVVLLNRVKTLQESSSLRERRQAKPDC